MSAAGKAQIGRRVLAVVAQPSSGDEIVVRRRIRRSAGRCSQLRLGSPRRWPYTSRGPRSRRSRCPQTCSSRSRCWRRPAAGSPTPGGTSAWKLPEARDSAGCCRRRSCARSPSWHMTGSGAVAGRVRVEQADAHGVVVDVVVRHPDVVGDRDLEADRAPVELVADDANVLGGRHPQRGVERAVGDVVLDQPVRGDGRVDPVLEVPRRIRCRMISKSFTKRVWIPLLGKSSDGEAADARSPASSSGQSPTPPGGPQAAGAA